MKKSSLFKKVSENKKKLVVAWLGIIILYLAWVAITDGIFELLTFSAILNIGLLPLIMINANEEKMQSKVEDAVAHFVVTNDKVIIGKDEVLVAKVKRVAIDVQDDYGYCSLPFNHLSPGVFPNFIFEKEQYESLRAHVTSALPQAQIIK